MSAPQFTPGPWHFVGDEEIEQVEHPFTSVAEVVRIFKDSDGAQLCANARLIAAAPELYGALTALVDEHDDWPEALAAKAALAKARGEQ